MLATLVYLVLVVAVFAAVGAPTLARRRPGGATLVEHVVAGVLTLTRLEERRRSTTTYRRKGTS